MQNRPKSQTENRFAMTNNQRPLYIFAKTDQTKKQANTLTKQETVSQLKVQAKIQAKVTG